MPKDPPEGLVRAGELLPGLLPPEAPTPAPTLKDVTLSQRAGKRAGRIVAVREDREQGKQRIGYLARPFVLCGLPFKKPDKGQTYYRRENGDEVLEITAPEHGLPFGMDYEVLIWVSTLAKKAMLKSGGKCPRVLEFASGADFLRPSICCSTGRPTAAPRNAFYACSMRRSGTMPSSATKIRIRRRFHWSMTSSSRSSARPAGLCGLQFSCRKRRHGLPAGCEAVTRVREFRAVYALI